MHLSGMQRVGLMLVMMDDLNDGAEKNPDSFMNRRAVVRGKTIFLLLVV